MQRTTNNLGGDGNDRSSVKVHHAPGGKSNISLGWEPEAPKQQQTYGKQQYANNQQQQSSFNDPYQKPSQSYGNKYDSRVDAYGGKQNDNSPSKTSVKVHHAPGGQSSLNLGSDPLPSYGGGSNQGGYGGNQSGYGSNQGGYSGNQGGYGSNQGGYGSNQGGHGGNQGGYGNNAGSGIYGGKNDHGKGQEPEKTSVRVHAPPGGKSNFTLG